MHISKSLRSLWFSIAVVGLTALTSGRAQASEAFPGALQEAADMQCVPLCTMCHISNPGSAGTWSKLLGVAVKTNGTKPGDAESLKAAFAKYKQTAAPVTLERIRTGREPEFGADVCGPTYGCAVHVAKQAAAPPDFSGPLLAVGAMVAAGILRRRRKSNGS